VTSILSHANSAILVRGGRVLDPSQGLDAKADLFLDRGVVRSCRREGEQWPLPLASEVRRARVLPAEGLIVSPGFIDLHCHLREPGHEQKETIASGTLAAAKGGFTTVCCMPNTHPAIDSQATVEYVLRVAKVCGAARVLPVGCITKQQKGEELAEMGELSEAGVVGFSDDGHSVPSSRLLRRALEYSRIFDLPIIEHCEDSSLAEGGVMHEGWVATMLGLKGIPAAAEETIVARDVLIAKLTQGRLHIAHASTAGTVDIVRRAKDRGLAVTAEVTPHHLTLTHETVLGEWPAGWQRLHDTLSYDTNTKVNPPLREASDVDALIEGLRDGTIDAIATDHAPHDVVDKLCEYDTAAFGISGLETALGVLLSLVHRGALDLGTIVSKLTLGPAMLVNRAVDELPRDSVAEGNGLVPAGLGTLRLGAPADVVIFDPNEEWVVDAKAFASKGHNSPYDGCLLKGRVKTTICEGRITYQG